LKIKNNYTLFSNNLVRNPQGFYVHFPFAPNNSKEYFMYNLKITQFL
jgi:hypothetical protein